MSAQFPDDTAGFQPWLPVSWGSLPYFGFTSGVLSRGWAGLSLKYGSQRVDSVAAHVLCNFVVKDLWRICGFLHMLSTLVFHEWRAEWLEYLQF